MSKPELRIPQEDASEIFALASQIQAKHEQSYSVAELKKIGAQAHISPEFVEQAVKQIQQKKKRSILKESITDNVTNLGAAIVLLSFLTGIMALPNSPCSPPAKTQPDRSQVLPNNY